ncbi:hypothetical protein FRACYDRAFT_196115 [Fragilariopsis cylindrus CCMP1102]|uniref:Helicase-associated domain-containing protein n=1 Tax=Fragilariopsis cylindrus CCMP1102 TaxID=635003 RepID=A0A1E7ERK4_9STRA|nr:hypothetical protein FRACYDRAFT_196115 [Fragilariopsis cylindrus CCMP1102]|eukprot:OEU08628.1 hypothetical protein FRACYDRAFT_196115 [Fragilariopsis cylindrus CCMP1102]
MDDDPPSEELSVIENTTKQRRLRSSSRRRHRESSSVTSSGVGGDDTDDKEYDDEDYVDESSVSSVVVDVIDENEYNDGDYINNDDDDTIDTQTRTKITGKRKYKCIANNKQWHGMFRRLVAYKNKHKSILVPSRYAEDQKLGDWVRTQRTTYKNDMIAENRVDILNSVGFVWEIFEQIPWHEMFRRLVAYQKKYGSVSVPRSYKLDPKLARWVDYQRTSYRKKLVSEEQIRLLVSIGFIWKHHEVIPWDEMFRKLISYKKEHNSTSVPRKYPADPNLGMWVSHQRTFFNNKTISIDRINRLESIDFVWDPFGEKWMELFHKLVAYKKKHKSTYVPKNYKEDPKLGRWVHHQRDVYKNKTISIDRINRLESIGFVWDPLDAQWMGMYQKLVAYKEQYRSTKVPVRYTEDPQLGHWVSWQREYDRMKKLTEKRTELLNSINFVWSKHKTSI